MQEDNSLLFVAIVVMLCIDFPLGQVEWQLWEYYLRHELSHFIFVFEFVVRQDLNLGLQDLLSVIKFLVVHVT